MLEALVERFVSEGTPAEERITTAATLARALSRAPPADLLRASNHLRQAGAALTLVRCLHEATALEFLLSPAPRLSGLLALTGALAGAAARAAHRLDAPVPRLHANAAAKMRIALREAGLVGALALLLEAVDPLARLYAYAAAEHAAHDPGLALELCAAAPLRSLERSALEDHEGNAVEGGGGGLGIFGKGARRSIGGSLDSEGDEGSAHGSNMPSEDELLARTAAYASGALANVLAHATAACARFGVAPPRVHAEARAAAARRMDAATARLRRDAATSVQKAARGRRARRQLAGTGQARKAARAAAQARAAADAAEAADLAACMVGVEGAPSSEAKASPAQLECARQAIAIIAELVVAEAAAIAAQEQGSLALGRPPRTPVRMPGARSSQPHGTPGSAPWSGSSARSWETRRDSETRRAVLDARLGRVIELDSLRAALEAEGADAPFARGIGPIPVRHLHSTVVRGFQRLRLLAAVSIQAHYRGYATRARTFDQLDDLIAARAARVARRARAASVIQSAARGMPARRARRAAREAAVAAREAAASSDVARRTLRTAAADAASEAAALPLDSHVREDLEREAFWLDATPMLDPKRERAACSLACLLSALLACLLAC